MVGDLASGRTQLVTERRQGWNIQLAEGDDLWKNVIWIRQDSERASSQEYFEVSTAMKSLTV